MIPIIPTATLSGTVARLVAEDDAIFDPDNGNFLVLLKEPFTPSRTLTYLDVTPATFNGSDPLPLPAGSALFGTDPISGNQIIFQRSAGDGFF